MKTSDFRKLQIRILRDYDEESIDGLYHAVQSSEADAKRRATSRIEELKNESGLTESEKNQYADMAGDDVFEAELIREIGEEMVVVALYRTVEISIKRILNKSGLFSEAEERQFYRIGKLKESVRRHVVDMERLRNL